VQQLKIEKPQCAAFYFHFDRNLRSNDEFSGIQGDRSHGSFGHCEILSKA
jgi:hypothetical protein